MRLKSFMKIVNRLMLNLKSKQLKNNFPSKYKSSVIGFPSAYSYKEIKIERISQQFIILCAFFIISSYSTLGQIPNAPGYASGSAANAYRVSEFDSINYFSGKLDFRLPLPSPGGRGNANIPLSYRVMNPAWTVKTDVFVDWDGAPHVTNTPVVGYEYDLAGKFNTGFVYASQTGVGGTICYNNQPGLSETVTKIFFIGPNGNQIEFRDQARNGQIIGPNCGNYDRNRGRVFSSVDGASATFISDFDIIDATGDYGPNNVNFFDSGRTKYYVSGMLYLKDGTQYKFLEGGVQWIRDPNGNTTTFSNTSDSTSNHYIITDSIGRKISHNVNRYAYLDPPESIIENFSYEGFGGNSRQIKIYHSSLHNSLRADNTLKTINELFGGNSQDPYFTSNYDGDVISKIVLPNDQEYKFKYNSYGELARVELPTGGAMEYDWSGGIEGGADNGVIGADLIYRRVIEKRTYSTGTTLEQKMIISRIPTGVSNVAVTVDTYDGASTLVSRQKHYYYGHPSSPYGPTAHNSVWSDGREYRTEIYDSNGTTLLRQINMKWEQPYFPFASTNSNNAPPNNPRITETTALLVDGNQLSKKTFAYDSFINLTDTFEYDYGVGATPGAFLRRSHTDYLTTNSVNGVNYASDSIHILNLPSQTWVSSDAAGSNKVSYTKFEYDNYSDAANDLNHDPLLDCPNISGHDAAFGTAYKSRGNLTAITGFANAANQTGGISSYRKYDIAGNPIEARDAKGYASFLDYTDRFGTPDAEARNNSAPAQLNGQQTFAFVTKSTNPDGYTTYRQIDYFAGVVVDAEDINGNVNSNFYNDPLDRPRQIIRANNRPLFRRQTTISYDDVAREVTAMTDSKLFNDNLLKTRMLCDKMGRTIEIRQYETATDYIATQQEYDALGRAYKSSNPFRPNAGESPQWTTSKFDSLGRTTEVKSPDNTIISRSYSGTTTTVTDQAMRKRSGKIDAIGRLTRVNEDPTGVNYETTYLYDVLGRLRKTTQIEGSITQNRYFMYNDLGRLIRAKQPEQIANASLPAMTDPISDNSSWSVAYSYDENGNIASTTDANNRSITAIYDNLNRLTLRDYSDSTPDVTFTYDDTNIANSKGQLTAITSSDSTTQFTEFDQLGGIKSSRQVTNGQTYNMPDYTYDLSGALVSQTYPSLRVVTTDTDNIGRLSKVLSQTPNQNARTYLNNLSYAASGAVRSDRLGNGAWESTQFDSQRLQVKQIGLGGSLNDTSYLKIEYSYGTTDNNGSLRQQKITVQNAAPITQAYDYDTLNRIHSATETYNDGANQAWKQTFAYDRFGNRHLDTSSGATTTLPQNNGSYNPDIDQAKNRFTVAEGYNYDNEGNLIGNPENQLFAYDSENHQTQVQGANGTANYYYDGLGRRVRKVIGTQETIFVYDAFGKMVAEYTLNQAITNEGTKYLTTDALGSPRAISDISGHVTSRHDYLPFGEEIYGGVGGRTAAQGYLTNGDGVRQQFTGYERDLESGLDYAQARYFSSKHGRFTSVDPLTSSASIKNPQTLNRYSYALNNPYKFTDSLGMKPCAVPGGGNTGCITEGDDGPCDPKTHPCSVTPTPESLPVPDASGGTVEVSLGEFHSNPKHKGLLSRIISAVDNFFTPRAHAQESEAEIVPQIPEAEREAIERENAFGDPAEESPAEENPFDGMTPAETSKILEDLGINPNALPTEPVGSPFYGPFAYPQFRTPLRLVLGAAGTYRPVQGGAITEGRVDGDADAIISEMAYANGTSVQTNSQGEPFFTIGNTRVGIHTSTSPIGNNERTIDLNINNGQQLYKIRGTP